MFALVTRRPYCPGGPKMLCFTTLSMVSITRLSVVKQSSFGLPGQYGVYGKYICMTGEKPGIFRVAFETKRNEG